MKLGHHDPEIRTEPGTRSTYPCRNRSEIWGDFPDVERACRSPSGGLSDCFGSRAAVARCGERVSLAPESRPTASSIDHLFSANRRRLWGSGLGDPVTD